MQEKKTYLVTFLVNVTDKKSGRPDQVRPRLTLTLMRAMDEKEVQRRIAPLAKAFGASCVVEEIDLLDKLEDIPASVRRYCKRNGFELLVVSDHPTEVSS